MRETDCPDPQQAHGQTAAQRLDRGRRMVLVENPNHDWRNGPERVDQLPGGKEGRRVWDGSGLGCQKRSACRIAASSSMHDLDDLEHSMK